MLETLNVKIFADGADIEGIQKLKANSNIVGFTTNPTLMRAAGVENYSEFAKSLIKEVGDAPISFEVFSDDLDEMYDQAKIISSWGNNVNVKIPVMNTKGLFTGPIISKLSNLGITLNITAIMTVEQVREIASVLNPDAKSIISVFAGRIADTGIDPIPVMKHCLKELTAHPNAELLWASPREVLNIFQADQAGCHIITVAHDLLKKTDLLGKNLEEYSKETVEMFYKDALAANYKIN